MIENNSDNSTVSQALQTNLSGFSPRKGSFPQGQKKAAKWTANYILFENQEPVLFCAYFILQLTKSSDKG